MENTNHKKSIMKSLIQLKIISVVILTCFLLSCKNNQDGYSDEIETTLTPVDSAKTPADTTKLNNSQNSTGSGGNTSGGNNTAASNTGNNTSTPASKSTIGTGSGPGESPKDGATYTNTKAADSLKTGYKKWVN